jgi:tRNA wybutosine-synthesizing protein 3
MKDEGAAVDPHFDAAKERVLQELVACIDRSKKGGVDAPIANLLTTLNGLPDYVTTSSCSGRVAIFCETDAAARKKSGARLSRAPHARTHPRGLTHAG